jgi:hypothetical protein
MRPALRERREFPLRHWTTRRRVNIPAKGKTNARARAVARPPRAAQAKTPAKEKGGARLTGVPCRRQPDPARILPFVESGGSYLNGAKIWSRHWGHTSVLSQIRSTSPKPANSFDHLIERVLGIVHDQRRDSSCARSCSIGCVVVPNMHHFLRLDLESV